MEPRPPRPVTAPPAAPRERPATRDYAPWDEDELAPVVTEEGAWGRVPPPYRPPERHGGAGPVWWVGALLVLTGAVWLAALSLSQLSSREVAMPAIESGVSALTEIDALLAIHEDDLCNLAEADAAIDVPGFPVQGVDVRIDDVQCTDGVLDREALRTLLLSRSAEQVYLNGADAFSTDSAATGDTSILSPSGGIRATLDSVGLSMHDRMEMIVLVLGVANAALLAIVLLLGRGIRRFAGVGLVLILAALPMLIGGLVLWFGLGTMTSGSGLTADFATITRSLVGLPLRNALVVAGAGLALLVPVLIVDRLVKRAQHEEWWEYSR